MRKLISCLKNWSLFKGGSICCQNSLLWWKALLLVQLVQLLENIQIQISLLHEAQIINIYYAPSLVPQRRVQGILREWCVLTENFCFKFKISNVRNCQWFVAGAHHTQVIFNICYYKYGWDLGWVTLLNSNKLHLNLFLELKFFLFTQTNVGPKKDQFS